MIYNTTLPLVWYHVTVCRCLRRRAEVLCLLILASHSQSHALPSQSCLVLIAASSAQSFSLVPCLPTALVITVLFMTLFTRCSACNIIQQTSLLMTKVTLFKWQETHPYLEVNRHFSSIIIIIICIFVVQWLTSLAMNLLAWVPFLAWAVSILLTHLFTLPSRLIYKWVQGETYKR